MSRRIARRGVAAALVGVLAGLLATCAIAVIQRAHHRDAPRHHVMAMANLADTVAPTGKVELPGVAGVPAATLVVAGTPLPSGTSASSTILTSRVALSGSVRGPPGAATA